MQRRFGIGLARLAAIASIALSLVAITGPSKAETLVDRAQLEAWADKYYGQAIAEKRTAGITVSVVQDGEVLFTKGYGYQDYARRIPLDPDASGFVVGSITKTFIATSIGQLVDRGQIASLDDPANKYLKRVKLPGEKGARVTIRQLLNHRAGFADVDFGYLDRNAEKVAIPLTSREISRIMPDLALEPGGPANYNNWSFSLLGFLIEDVTGQRLDAYLKANIFDPLGMAHTTLAYGRLPANLSQNYVFEKDGTPVHQPNMLAHPWIAPAGGIVSTASDMARYMRAQVLRGRDGGYPLVSPRMFDVLQTESYRNAPISIGFAHTFWTQRLNGAQTIEHGGGAPGFQSMMMMIPEKRFGFFVSTMQGGLADWASYTPAEQAKGHLAVEPAPTGYEMREAFVERFLKPDPVVASGRKSDLSKLVGVYWTQKRPYSTVELLGQLFDPSTVMRIGWSKDRKGLTLNGYGPYTDLGGGVFVSPTGRTAWTGPYAIDRLKPADIAFNFDDKGKIAYLTAGLADQAWAPASPIFNPHAMLRVFVVLGGVAATGALLLLWPQRRRFANPTNYLGLAAALAVVAFPAAFTAGFGKGDSLLNQMALGDRGRLWIMVLAANATIAIAAFLTVTTVLEWRRPNADGTAPWAWHGFRIHASVVTLSALGLLVVFAFFKLLGLHLPG